MTKHNPNNERIKRNYLRFLKESRGQDESSLDAVAMALSRFESYIKHRDFKKFNIEQAMGFKKNLSKQINKQTGKPLSKSTLNTTLRHLKGFFQWLAMQNGYRSFLTYTDADYFNLSEKDTRIATTNHAKPVPTIEQIKHVLDTMPSSTDIERRNKALIAFTLLTGARDNAIASIKLKHLNLKEGPIYQDAREVNTKFSKSFETFFFPVGDEIHQIVIDWVNYLQDELLWGNDDPLFPKTEMTTDKDQQFKATGLLREHWSNATPIRKIFRKAFIQADLPYFNPHSFRNTLSRLGQQACTTAESFKAWSQNLGHANVLTTFTSYGEVQVERQGELIHGLASPEPILRSDVKQLAKALMLEMQSSDTK